MAQQPREFRNLCRFAMEQSDNTHDTVADPEKVKWLQNAVNSMSIDVVKIMKSDIALLSAMLVEPELEEESAKAVMDELLSFTDDIDVANDFFKVGGKELLLNLLFSGPPALKECSYQLLANLTQNNPNAQQICLAGNCLQQLLTSVREEDKLECIKKNLLSISCLVRHYDPGVAAFCEADGFTVVIERLLQLTDKSLEDSEELLEPVVLKGAFFILSLILELPAGCFNTVGIQHLPDKLAKLIMQSPFGAQEHLVRSLVILLSGSLTVDDENQPTQSRSPLYLSPTVARRMQLWSTQNCRELERIDDPAHLELKQYLQRLNSLLNNRNN